MTMIENHNVIGENIKKKMDEKNLTTFELADRLKITTVELCRYINGRRMPKAPLIFQMAKELDCTADELLGIEEPAQADEEPNEPTVQDVIKWLKSRAQNVTMAGARKMFQAAAAALERQTSLTDIYVRDKQSGRIHRVGDDQHDQLTIWEDGHLHYFNLQNGDGCSTKNHGEGCGYEFVPNVDDYGFNYDPREVNNGRISE